MFQKRDIYDYDTRFVDCEKFLKIAYCILKSLNRVKFVCSASNHLIKILRHVAVITRTL